MLTTIYIQLYVYSFKLEGMRNAFSLQQTLDSVPQS